MIKYIGSKRRLVPALSALFAELGPRRAGAGSRSGAGSGTGSGSGSGSGSGFRALDLFTGTTRVAQALKQLGAEVTAVDSTRFATTFAACYVATDATGVDRRELAAELERLDALPGSAGYVTETFCVLSRYFQPHNGARIDAIRQAIADDHAGSALEPVLLTSLLEAADRVDSTTGLQMAYVKEWAQRSYRPLQLRMPELLPGPGRAVRGDACSLVGQLGEFDIAYLDPPYNQHRYDANYHVWETIVAWDAPSHYGVACKRDEIRQVPASVFNSRRSMPAALAGLVAAVPCRVLVLSYNDESFLSHDELREICAVRGHVEVLSFDSARYVGARIGIHDPAGRKVGTVGRLRNVEYVLVAGEGAEIAGLVRPLASA
ncbi:MAG: DNA adenine methylase [Acidimicrobiales bacterium]